MKFEQNEQYFHIVSKIKHVPKESDLWQMENKTFQREGC